LLSLGNSENLNDIPVINEMIQNGNNFTIQKFGNWFDTGNVDGLSKARKEIPDSFHILDKLEESIYIYDDFVVKFFYNQELSDKRVERTKYLI
jgi:dTDP-glucose pyrophosphorylase